MSKRIIWKNIPEYEGLYQVSNYGEVKSFHYKPEKIMKNKTDKDGYKSIGLSKNGNVKHFRIHVLVYKSFIDNKYEFNQSYCIDHIDNDPSNNNLDNLQLVTQRINCHKDKKNTSSKYIGVFFHNQSKRYRAKISINYKAITLGNFKTEEEAANAYQIAIKNISKYKGCTKQFKKEIYE